MSAQHPFYRRPLLASPLGISKLSRNRISMVQRTRVDVPRQILKQTDNIAADQGLAPGDPNLADAAADESCAETIQLLKGEQIPLW